VAPTSHGSRWDWVSRMGESGPWSSVYGESGPGSPAHGGIAAAELYARESRRSCVLGHWCANTSPRDPTYVLHLESSAAAPASSSGAYCCDLTTRSFLVQSSKSCPFCCDLTTRSFLRAPFCRPLVCSTSNNLIIRGCLILGT
jgi:hypothetical protein